MWSPAYPVFDPLAVHWRLPPGLVLSFRRVGTMTAVFNKESEDTHLFHPLVGRLLGRLAGGEVIAGATLSDWETTLRDAGLDPSQTLRECHALGVAEPFEP